MDNRGKRQSASIFGGMGFYIALLVCVIAAGVVGYFALLRNDPEPDPAPVSNAASEPSQDVVNPDPEPAAPVTGTAPVIVERPAVRPAGEEPEEKAPPAPQTADAPPAEEEPVSGGTDLPVMEPAPIETVEPMVIVSPLAGDTVAVFSVDHLTYDATLGDWRTHDGIDIKAEKGTEVMACADGVISRIYDDALWGCCMEIEHSGGIVSVYCGLDKTSLTLNEGDAVKVKDVIGQVDKIPCEISLQSHLHFGMKSNGKWADPVSTMGLG